MKIKKSQLIISYKLFEVITFLTLFVWAIALIAENILPGFISNHLSFLKLTIFASTLIIISALLGKKLELSYEIKTKKWLLLSLTILSVIIISLSLIKFHWIEIIIITTTSIFIMFYFYKILFKEYEN